MRMSAEFLPDWRTCGISISSNDASCIGGLELLVALPVAVRLLHDDAALEQQALEHLADVELVVLRVAHAERDVLEVAEQRHVGDVGGSGHAVGYSQVRPAEHVGGILPPVTIRNPGARMTSNFRRFAKGPAIALAFMCICAAAFAQDWPARPIRMIVPYPPAGGTDIVARTLNEKLAPALGATDRRGQQGRRRRQPRHRPRRQVAAGWLHGPVHAVVAHDQPEAVSQAAVRRRARFRGGEPGGDDPADPGGAPFAAGEQRAGAHRLRQGAIPASSTTPRSASAPRDTLPASSSSCAPARAWCTFRTRAAVPRSPTRMGGQVQLLFVSLPAAWQYVKAGKLKALGVTSEQAQHRRAGGRRRSPSRACRIAWSTRGTARSCRRRRRRP